MKATVLGVLSGVLVVLLAGLWGGGAASADNGPHMSGQSVTTDSCAGCHRAHTAQAANLLKVSETALCSTCHDGSGATTMVDAGVTTGGGALRAGGFQQARINTQDSNPVGVGVLGGGQTTTSSHSTDGSSQELWGNSTPGSGPGFAGFQLTCISCHDPHGNGNYRILRPAPASEGGATDTTAGVNVPDESPKVYTTTNYFDNGPVIMSGANAGKSWLSSWCAQCHTRYLAPGGSATTALPGEPIFKFRHDTQEAYAPSCVKCHAAHGSNAAVSGYAAQVAWPGGTAVTTETGGSRLLKMDNSGICLNCHPR